MGYFRTGEGIMQALYSQSSCSNKSSALTFSLCPRSHLSLFHSNTISHNTVYHALLLACVLRMFMSVNLNSNLNCSKHPLVKGISLLTIYEVFLGQSENKIKKKPRHYVNYAEAQFACLVDCKKNELIV